METVALNPPPAVGRPFCPKRVPLLKERRFRADQSFSEGGRTDRDIRGEPIGHAGLLPARNGF